MIVFEEAGTGIFFFDLLEAGHNIICTEEYWGLGRQIFLLPQKETNMFERKIETTAISDKIRA